MPHPSADATAFVAACAQVDVVLGDIAANDDIAEAAIRRAHAEHGARLVVLPECQTSGYVFADAGEAAAASQEVDGGRSLRMWAALARELDVWICGGFVERSGDAVYNSAALVGPEGVAGLYRKVHLWNSENDLYTAGDLGFPVVETPLGRVGMMICYDAWFPESVRSSALDGADLVCAPSDWVANPLQPADKPTLAEMMIVTAAHSSQLEILVASRVGRERGVDFIGCSLIASSDGWLRSGPAGDRPAIISAAIDPIGSRQGRRTNPFNRPLHDRRPDSYRH